ncbi:10045_t:CDS:2, partial [Gigaspora rosea]
MVEVGELLRLDTGNHTRCSGFRCPALLLIRDYRFWRRNSFCKSLFNVKTALLTPKTEESDLEDLKHYTIIENNEIYLEQGIVCSLDGRLYINGESSNMQLPSKLMENFGGMPCLPNNIFFLIVKKGGPAKSGCAITGTPGTRKLYFGFYLLFYLYYKYPNATIVWYCNENICYQFMPDGNVLEGDIYQFGITLKIRITFCSLKSPNNPSNWPGFTKFFMPIWDQEEITTLWALQHKNARNYKNEESVLLKWDDDTYQKEYQQLINEANFDKYANSIDKSGVPTGSIS